MWSVCDPVTVGLLSSCALRVLPRIKVVFPCSDAIFVTYL